MRRARRWSSSTPSAADAPAWRGSTSRRSPSTARRRWPRWCAPARTASSASTCASRWIPRTTSATRSSSAATNAVSTTRSCRPSRRARCSRISVGCAPRGCTAARSRITISRRCASRSAGNTKASRKLKWSRRSTRTARPRRSPTFARRQTSETGGGAGGAGPGPAGADGARAFQASGTQPLVQWDTPIPPPEAAEILARMSAFKEATVYKVGQSYLGKDVWAMDLMPPVEASHWSQAKQTMMKPTIVYSARQHANEVSSTSHVLKMAELLLTDPAFKEKLNRVNVVIHPITNADGAQLAYDLQKITPNHMLHAGYLGSLGVDVTSGQWDPDPLYPESGIRPKIWRTWLPDIFLNPHGYPSHEWVQLFSEYAAWVRTRSVETRDYWTMRGWWMPGFGWLDDARYPRHKDEQMKLLNMITEYAKQAPGTVALNERAYARYKRYSFDFDQKNFKLDFTNGVLIYKSIKGARANPQSQDFMTRQPNVTIWDGVTEAPDETARGDWLKLVANAGLQWDKAILNYLVQGHHEVERSVTPFWNGASLTMTRPRPPKPPKDDAAKTSTQAGQ